jgi:hypothetical protein
VNLRPGWVTGLATLFMMLCISVCASPIGKLRAEISYLETKRDAFDIQTIQGAKEAGQFSPLDTARFSRGYTGGTDHWFLIVLNKKNTEIDVVLEFSNPRLHDVTLYYPDRLQPHESVSVGAHHPFWSRPLSGLTPAFSLAPLPGQSTICYVRVRHFGSLRFDIRLWERDAYQRTANQGLALYALFSGAFLTLALYNFCIFLHLRQRGNLWLALFLAAINLNVMVTSGTANMLLWTEPNWFSIHAMTITNVLCLCLGTLLCNNLLREAPGARLFTRLNVALAFLGIAGGLMTLTKQPMTFYVLFAVGILAPLSVTAMGVSALIARQRSALHFLCCWGLMLLAVLVFASLGPGYIPATQFTEHFIFLAIFLATIGWSLTLTRQLKLREWELRNQLEKQLAAGTAALASAREEVEALHGLLPICCSCKKIRDDDGYWQHVETYFQTHTEADFSHGICPECAGDLYPKYFPKPPKTEEKPPT